MAEDNGANENNEYKDEDDDICRDFLRNVCTRGKRCKYRHPQEDEVGKIQKTVEFCHDFQNSQCRRSNCKFVHCTREEEEVYKQTGELPEIVQRRIASGIQPTSATGEIPVCKDFQKGECHRGSRCKYRHVDEEYPLSRGLPRRVPVYDRYSDRYEALRRDPYYDLPPADIYGLKRRRYDDYDDRYISPSEEWQQLKDENAVWRSKCQQLEKQITELKAKNEILMEQNAQLTLQRQAQLSNAAAAASVQNQAIAQMAHRTLTGGPLKADMSIVSSLAPQGTPTLSAAANASLAQPIGQDIMSFSHADSPSLVSYPMAAAAQGLRPTR